MNPIVKLLKTDNPEDFQIARAIILLRYRDKIKKHAYNIFQDYYLIGPSHIENIIGESLEGVDSWIQMDFTHEELFKNLKQKTKMTYKATKHRNICKEGNSYRVRKYINGRSMSASFPTIKDCKEWLHLWSK